MASLLAGVGMGKRRSGKPTGDNRVSILLLKGSAEYRDWLDRLAEFARLSKQDAVDHGLVELAKRIGFPEPPPKR